MILINVSVNKNGFSVCICVFHLIFMSIGPWTKWSVMYVCAYIIPIKLSLMNTYSVVYLFGAGDGH